jgi:glucans biosynthesis protein C
MVASAAEGAVRSQASKRLYYLDNLKVVALVLGLFVHGDNFIAADDHLWWVVAISSHFRMATFFLVAGFFAVMVADRRGYREFYKRRFLALGVPLLVGFFLLNSINIPLKDAYRAYFIAHEGVDIVAPTSPPLLHLWFLASLLFYVTLAPLFIALLRTPLVTAAAARLSASPLLAAAACFLVTLGVVGCCLGVRLVASALEFNFIVRSTFYYMPFFVIGCLLFAHQETARIFYRLDVPSIALAIGLGIAANYLPPESTAGKIADFGSLAASQCAITFGLLWFFRRFVNFSNGMTQMLSRSVYTMYILHFLLITIAASIWIRILPTGAAQAFVTAAIVGVIGVLAHVWLVERSAVFAFLLNGKLPDAATKPEPARPSVSGT